MADPQQSAIFTTMPAGQFTAILAGKNGGSGIGIIEIYISNASAGEISGVKLAA